MKLFLTSDSGGSGHASTGVGTALGLLRDSEVEVNWSTHQWGWLRNGFTVQGQFGRQFPDFCFRERLLCRGYINSGYFLDTEREFRKRPWRLEEVPFGSHELGERGDSSLIVKQFSGEEDVNVAVGSPQFAERQPTGESDVFCVTETTVNTSRCPEEWSRFFEVPDEVWVPCRWSGEAVKRSGIDAGNVEVVPYGVEWRRPTGFCDRVPRLMETDKYVFGVVARWCNLKGLDVLLKAYMEEFVPSRDDVVLFIKTTTNNQLPLTPQHVEAVVQSIARELRIVDVPEIGFSTEPFSTQEYWDLLGTFDCYVHPSRAEAIGISIVEAAGLGIPVITTNYSAPAEYLKGEPGAWLIECDEVEVQQHDDRFYHYDEYRGEWGNPDVEHLKELMRELYETRNGDIRQATLDTAVSMRTRFSWEKALKKRKRRLFEVA